MSGPLPAVVAAIAAGFAMWLALPAAPRPDVATALRRRWHRSVPLVTAATTVGGALLLATPRVAALVAVGLTVAGGARALLRRRAARAQRAETARRVLESCELVAAELASGQPPGAALRRASSRWSGLEPVVQAQALGADVPGSLRQLAASPGAEDLRLVAAAWQVAHRSGHGLADAVDRVAVRIRAQRQTRRVVESELASARATARLVAGLPVLALTMGSGTGASPWAFLLGTPIGLACLAGGLGLVVAGLWWIEAIADTVERP